MQITSVDIRNFKAIRRMEICDIENVLILVGKNNTGKTSVLDAIRAAAGCCEIKEEDFNEKRQNIEIGVAIRFTQEDLIMLHRGGIVSQYKRYDVWERDFLQKLPSFDGEILEFTFIANWKGGIRYSDGYKKDNHFIKQVFPKIYYIDEGRGLKQFQEDLLMFQEDDMLKKMRANVCMFTPSKKCSHCFQCIGLINRKVPVQLSAFETSRLLEYKLYQMNIEEFTKKVNDNYRKNGGAEEIRFSLNCNSEEMFRVKAETYREEHKKASPVEHLSKGMRSIYLLSLLETYVGDENRIPSIILIEDPEIFLHPHLQKVSSEILYRLSKKNQVIFSTHSPNLLFHFTRPQIRQVVLDEDCYSVVKEHADIDVILDDLGYGANDFMNVSFVFIVEGKQDKSRLPLLLQKYYSEIYKKDGTLARISIITTNSCTNIKTYANLKYMNQVYLRDQFLMIRDGDGQDRDELARQLCRYYDERGLQDADKIPKVTRRNVLILKYYSFENYFLNPSIMTRLGVVESEEAFYDTLIGKWKEYLHQTRSGKHLTEILGKELETAEELKRHMEEFKVYVRGHNLYDIFYGPYRKQETELLLKYIELAPREEFADILDAVDRFIYFDNRKR